MLEFLFLGYFCRAYVGNISTTIYATHHDGTVYHTSGSLEFDVSSIQVNFSLVDVSHLREVDEIAVWSLC